MAFELDVTSDEIDAFTSGMKAIIAMPLESILQIMCSLNFVIHQKNNLRFYLYL